MNFVRKILGGAGSAPSDDNALWLYVQCNKCGAPVAIRVDTRNDVSMDYESGGKYLRKEIMDSTCFQLIYADVRFDASGTVSEQSIQGGKFLSKEEFEQAEADFKAKRARQ